MPTPFATNVRTLLNSRCLKQGAFAKSIGYSAQTFSAMVNGRKVVTAEDVMRVAKALNVTPNDLLLDQAS